jgi:MFS family permease
MSAGAAQDNDSSLSPAESAPSQPEPHSATSQGFYPPPEPSVLRRSLIISACASMFGSMFFTIVQGTVFNFLLEDLSLRDRLPYFTALWCIGELGNLVGSWIQNRWGCRKSLFLVTIGGSRLLWLAIGLIPLIRPEWTDPKAAFWWLSILTVSFYFIHAVGGPAWLSWMADLVPSDLSNKYWSLRQVGCSASAIAAGLGTGFYLESHRNWAGYAAILCFTTVLGVIDACMFIPVLHRRPKIRAPGSRSMLGEFASRMHHEPFRRLCCIYILWTISNCIMNPTCFYFMRDSVQMGISSIAIANAMSMVTLTVFALLWGKYSDHHGHRGPLILCLMLHAFCPVFYYFAGNHDIGLVTVAMVVGAIGFCGVNLYMIPLLIQYSRSEGSSRDVGIAVFKVAVAVANFTALIITDRVLFQSVGHWLHVSSKSTSVYLAIMAIGMFLRACAAALVWLLPKAEKETHPTRVLSEVVSAHPLRAAYSFVKYVTGREGWVGVGALVDQGSKSAEQKSEESGESE